MKKLYTILTLLSLSSAMFGQTFTNAGGDNLWSNTANWDTMTLPVAGSAPSLALGVNAILDISTTIDRLSVSNQTVTASGPGKITFDGTTNIAILGTGSSATNIATFDAPLELNGPMQQNLQVNSTRTLILGPNSILTLTTDGNLRAGGSGFIILKGVLNGGANLNMSAYDVLFDTTSNNSAFTGNFSIDGTTVTLIANTVIDGGFVPATSTMTVNGTNATLTLGSANIFDGNLDVTGINNFSINVNANQGSMGTVGVADGILTLIMNAGVTNLSLANSSGIAWGTGSINITGFTAGVIRFGTDNSGLTSQQLSQITADGAATGNSLELDANGYLIVGAPLSTDKFELESAKRISYPSVVENRINFSKPLSSVQVYDSLGKKVLEVSKASQLENLSTSLLRSGLYFMVLDGVKTEKFLKK